MTQLNRRFPIFGKSARMGKLADTSNQTITAGFPNFYVSNTLAFEKGFIYEPTTEQLNGMFNFLTEALSDLYTRGIPRFTLNLAYPKGAVVSFNGNLYVSLCDENIKHVSQSDFWGKVQFTKNEPTKETDDMPIGTILTVPVTTERKGYIDYVEGQKFTAALYPELYRVLGRDSFPITNSSGDNLLPIGSILHTLSTNPNVPDGFIEWDTRFGSLRNYPELKRELEMMAQRLPDPMVKSIWLDALRADSLPRFEDFYLGIGSVGDFKQDSIRQTVLHSVPVVVDYSNTLNPLGMTRCVAQTNTFPVVADGTVSRSQSNSNVVVTGLNADQYPVEVDKREYLVTVGNGDVTRPKTLFTRILVKATNPRPSAISSTHKQIIKAFD